MAASSSSAMKSSLVLILLLSAVVTSQAHAVSCTNHCNKPIRLNGMWLDPGVRIAVDLTVNLNLEIAVLDVTGKLRVGEYVCHEGVTGLLFGYSKVKLSLTVTVVAVSNVLDLVLKALLGIVSTVISPCVL